MVEHDAFGRADTFPDRRQHRSGRPPRRPTSRPAGCRGRPRPSGSRKARWSMPAAPADSRRPRPRARDQPGPFQLKQDLNQVPLGNPVLPRDLANMHRADESGSCRASDRTARHAYSAFAEIFIESTPRTARRTPAARASKLTAVERVQAAFRLGMPRPATSPLVFTRLPPHACMASSRSRHSPDRAAGYTARHE